MKHEQDLRYTSFSVNLRLQREASQPILTNKRTNQARERSLGPPDAKRAQDLCYTTFNVDFRLQREASQPMLTNIRTKLAREKSLGYLTRSARRIYATPLAV